MNTHYKKLALVSSGILPTTRPPAALAFLAGVCEKNNVEYTIHDLNIELLHDQGDDTWHSMYEYYYDLFLLPKELRDKLDDFLKRKAKEIVDLEVDCIAITLLSQLQVDFAEIFLSHVRSITDKITIIAGGPGVSNSEIRGVPITDQPLNIAHLNPDSFGRTLAKKDLVDYYVMGEGDIIFDQFLHGVVDLPGLNTKDTVELWQPQIDNLDNNILPTYKKINFSLYNSNKQMPTITITGSRGCVRRCTFCDVGHHWKKFRFRSGDNIAQEILKHHLEINTTDFFFSDSLLNGSISEFTALLEKMIEYKKIYPSLENLSMWGQFIIRGKAHHPEKLYRLMRDAGCTYIQTGIESGSESIRNHMGKKFNNEDIDYHFEMCEKYGIANWLFMMVAYPTETRKDFNDSIDMLHKYQKYLINGTIAGTSVLGPASIVGNTPLASLVQELGIHFHENTDEWLIKTNPDLTISERFLRYIEFTKTAVDLGYPIPSEIHQIIDSEMLRYKGLTTKTKKVLFNIEVNKSSYYS